MHDIEQAVKVREGPPRRPRRWPWLTVAVVAVSGGMIAGLTLTSSPPPVSAACQRATAAQNAYVDRMVALGYPDTMPVFSGMQVLATDIALLNDMTKAGCPGNTVIHTLPGG